MQNLLPDIKEFVDYFTFQQDSAHAHRSQETVDLLKRDTRLHHCGLQIVQTSIPVDYKIWGVLQQRVYSWKIQNLKCGRVATAYR